eukprot:s275_g35.t1
MTRNEYEVLELYAGQQRLVKLAKGMGMKAAAMDRDYDTLGDNKSKNNAMDMNTSGGFVLSCVMVLRAKWGAFLGLLGVVCSTFVSISRGSTMRSPFLPQGCPVSLAVYKANKGLGLRHVLGPAEAPHSPPPPRAAAELGSGNAGPTGLASPEAETQPGVLNECLDGTSKMVDGLAGPPTPRQSLGENASSPLLSPATPLGDVDTAPTTCPPKVAAIGGLNGGDFGHAHDPKLKRAAPDDADEELYVAVSLPPPVLSEKAVYMRLNRVFKKRQDGTSILDDKWNKAWADVDGGGRDEIYSIFEKVGYERDRKTKRHISQEISEWEEEVGKGNGHDVPPEAPELEWGFMEGNQQEETPVAPGHNAGEFRFALRRSKVSLLLDKAIEDADTAPVPVESEEVKREMDKLQFPQVEGDTAPSALVPKACGSLQKQVSKLEAMMETCNSVDRLSPLQERRLDIKFFWWDRRTE